MSDHQNNKRLQGASVRPGLRLIKSEPSTDVIAQITQDGGAHHGIKLVEAPEKKKPRLIGNSMLKQLNALADNIDAEVAMILKI